MTPTQTKPESTDSDRRAGLSFLMDNGKRFLDSQKKYPNLVSGQLLTPLTTFAYLGGPFAIDNGAYSGFPKKAFLSLLDRQREAREHCLWVAAPDVVGAARRTLEAFERWGEKLAGQGWPVALVAQDGQEDLPVPWGEIACLFVGGTTDWKMSQAAADLVKTAKILGKLVHVGRINTPARFRHFADLGADTCDGSGASRYDWMLERIAAKQFDDHPLLEAVDDNDPQAPSP